MKKLFIFLLSLALLQACSRNDDSPDLNQNLEVNLGANDPVLFSTIIENNRKLEVYGQRDVEGIPTSIDYLILNDNNNGESLFLMDQSGRISYIKSSDGSVLKFDWQESFVELTVISALKEEFFTTTVDFNNNGVSKADKQSNYNDVSSTSQNNSAPKPLSLIKSDEIQNSNINTDANIELNLLRCGSLTTYDGVVRMEVEFAGVIRSFVLSQSSVGVFQGQISASTLPPLEPAQMCSSVIPLTNNLCQAYEVNPEGALILGNAICAQIAAYGSATVVGAPLATAIGTACAAINTFFSLTCSVLPNLVQNLCNSATFQDFSLTGQDVYIRAVLSGPDGNYEGNWVQVNISQPIPTQVVNLGDEYLHLYRISGTLENCPTYWDVYVDDVFKGVISSGTSVFTTISDGDHTIYLRNGDIYSVDHDKIYTLPCHPLYHAEAGVVDFIFGDCL